MTLAVFLDDLNPYAIELWRNGPIRWYGLSYLFGFFLAYLIIRRVTRVGISPIKPEQVGDLIITLAIGVVVGGRLGYVLFYNYTMLWEFSPSFPFWAVLAINRGGMASHGGMIGGMVASWLYARQRGISWAHVLDLFAFGAPLGLFFGRLANFVNGELYGRPCSPTLPWAVKFPQEMFNWPNERLVQLRPVLSLVPRPPGVVHPNWDDWISQIIAAIQDHNQKVISLVEPLLTPRHPSQLYEALLEGLFLFAVLAIVWLRPRKPLVLGATFCIVYAAVRIIGEQFRMPDIQIRNEEFAHWGVTRGQLLSVLLLVAGLVIVTVASLRKVEPMGGWRPMPTPAPSK